MLVYSKQELLEMLERASNDMPLFYTQGFVNYTGRTSDTKEFYTELISAWCLEHLDLIESIPQITRKASYQTVTHTGVPEHPDSNRTEELVAMAIFRQKRLPLVGTILDYQTPLKNKRTDRAGKFDLLAYDGSILRILELKEPESTETMLRCVLEGYTYLQTVDQEKLRKDFDLPASTPILACPFVFYGGEQWEEMQQGRPQLQKLMAKLSCVPYYLQKLDNETYTVLEEQT